MNTRKLPQELALDIMGRSNCAVRMGAVIADSHGIVSWGWNHTKLWGPPTGHGKGVHAEIHAMERANPKRMTGATIYVAGERTRNSRSVEAMPCRDCMRFLLLFGIKKVVYRHGDEWKTVLIERRTHAL